ncbi:MAG TPA: hypothetical protein VMR98_02775, partial [Candidatus Polarisedimenticolaceae bacterium]|nr:hypothetical protein [Candidatus Polarisedimenticolaceae bacterium]
MPQIKHEQQELIVTARGHKQNMDQAMRGKIERGLVELITNSDDSYRDLAESSLPVNGAIRIEVERRRNQPSIVTIKDRAEGMNRDEMRTKLTKVGQRTSGFEKGMSRRGLLGRGSRDVASFGRVRFESIQDEKYNHFVIDSNLQTYFTDSRPLPADARTRKNMGVLKGNGTKITVEVDNRFTVPAHDNFARMLSKYYSLRDIMSDPSRKVSLVDAGQGREDKLTYVYPEGEEVYNAEIKIKDYPEARGRLILKLHNTPFPQDKSPEREGILIKSGAAIHDCTHFGLEPEPLAWRFSGYLFCPYIDQLLREYDDEEEQSSAHTNANPFRLLSPDRDGLLSDHPFTKALVRASRDVFESQIEQLRTKEDEGKRKVTNSRLSDRLKALSKSVSEIFAQKLMDLDADIDPGLEDTGPLGRLSAGLHIIPGGDIPIIAGEPKTFSLVLKQNDIIPLDQKIQIDATNLEILTELRDSKFTNLSDGGKVGKTTFTVLGITA